MSTYVADFKGFIADVPIAYFKRCDNRRYVFDKLTAATVTPNIEMMDINAGWSIFPVASLPGGSTFEMQLTSGEFNAELFSMANAIEDSNDYVLDDFEVPQAEWLKLDANRQLTLKHTPIAGTVSIKKMTLGTTAAAGVYTIEDNVITFAEADATDATIEVNYVFNEKLEQILIDNKSAAIGECTLEYPVYGTGDDCSEANIIGYYYVRVFRARITTMPGFDASYKSAQTYQFTLTALDASHLRNDEYAYVCAYKRGKKADWGE